MLYSIDSDILNEGEGTDFNKIIEHSLEENSTFQSRVCYVDFKTGLEGIFNISSPPLASSKLKTPNTTVSEL